MNAADRRFTGWSCRGGTVERWGNTPLLYSIAALQAALGSGKPTFYVARGPELEPILPQLARWQPRVLWQHETIVILGFETAATAAAEVGGAPDER
jgi:hypothetical protein